VAIIATEKTRTAESAVRATCFRADINGRVAGDDFDDANKIMLTFWHVKYKDESGVE
jgi:hypothetical protein